jgi:hypothetical protein
MRTLDTIRNEAREDALDEAWEAVNALGGVPQNEDQRIAAVTLDCALLQIEQIGGMDPACRRAERNATASRLIAAE